MDMFVRQSWTESRLNMPNDIFEEGDDYVTLPPEFFENVWQPDPYFLNSKVSGDLENYIPRKFHSLYNGNRKKNSRVSIINDFSDYLIDKNPNRHKFQ